MSNIDLPAAVRREIELLAAAWKVGPGEAVSRLVDHYHLSHSSHVSVAETIDVDVPVHRVYGGVHIEGRYNRKTRSLTVTSAPLPGQRFATPSGARMAVVSAINPTISPNGSGWNFWIVSATGETLRSIRHSS